MFSSVKFENVSQQCHLHNKHNGTGPIPISNPYGGIPENLITNSIGFIILVGIFLILRKSAWKVVHKIVKKDDIDRWTQIFFSFSAENVLPDATNPLDCLRDHHEQSPEETRPQDVQPHPRHFEAIHAIPEEEEEEEHEEGPDKEQSYQHSEANSQGPMLSPETTRLDDDEQDDSSRSPLERRFTLHESVTFGEWIKSIFVMKDNEIEAKCGNDAVQYLRFERYILFYLAFAVLVSIGIILPLNFQGTLQGDVNSFEHTTLVNLNPDSPLLWAHVALSFILFPLAIIIMRRFSVGVRFQDVAMELSRTLMIENVPKHLCNMQDKEKFIQHFHEAFSGVEVKDLRFAYDVEKAMEVHDSLMNARLAKEYCKHRRELKKPPIEMYPIQCSRCFSCFCCCCSTKVEAIQYYSEEEVRLEEQFEKEKANALSEPIGIMFVTFKTLNMAKLVYDGFSSSVFNCTYQPPDSTLSRLLKIEKWKVGFATTPDDIYWENLAVGRHFYTLKKFIMNLVLFFITFFLTTPEYIVSQTDFVVGFLGKEFKMPSWLVDFVPTIMLWSFTALLPLLVAWSDRFLGHWTRSGENHAIMKKTFWYLLFMVILLPTFGFTTADAVFKFILNSNGTDSYRWECVFLPDSGAFFVNYIITAALVGAGLELIRFPELIWYMLQVCWSKSRAETPAIRRAIKYEFRFGEQYARLMLIFCMTMMYSMSCPLITPFGFLFFVTKHYVDRHNILYAYKPSKINKKVHSTAISFVILSVVVLQFFMTVFFLLRSANLKTMSLLSKVMIGLFFISVNVFSAQIWSQTCKKLSPIDYVECTYLRDDVEYDRDYVYLPDILKTSAEKSENPSTIPTVSDSEAASAVESRQDYSDDDNESHATSTTATVELHHQSDD